MLAFRYVAAMSTGAALALGYASPSAAQTASETSSESEPTAVPTVAVPPAPTAATIDTLSARDEAAIAETQPFRPVTAAPTRAVLPVAGRRRPSPPTMAKVSTAERGQPPTAASTAEPLGTVEAMVPGAVNFQTPVKAIAPALEPQLAATPLPPLFESKAESAVNLPELAQTPRPAAPAVISTARSLAAAQTTPAPAQAADSPLLALASAPDAPLEAPTWRQTADEWRASAAIASPIPPLALALTADAPRTRQSEFAQARSAVNPIFLLAAVPDAPVARSAATGAVVQSAVLGAVDEASQPAAIASPIAPLALVLTKDAPGERELEVAPPVPPSLAAALVTASDRRVAPAADEVDLTAAVLPLVAAAPLPVSPRAVAIAKPSAAIPVTQPRPTSQPLWLAQADAPASESTDELNAPPEPLFQDVEEIAPFAPEPGDFGVRDNAAPLVQQPEIINGRQPVPPPENLNPSANPLLFPTEPDEVMVDLTQPISLVEAIDLARQNNQDFRTAFLNLERAQVGLRAALAAQYPTLDASATLSRTDSAQSELSNRTREDNAFSSLIGDQDTITDAVDGRIELNYNIYDGGRRPAQIREAERAIRFNQLEVERIDEQIRLQTTNSYYGLQEADARVDIEQAAVENAQQTLRDAELLEEAGLGTRFDVLRAQVDLANSNQNLTNALSTQRVSRRELVQVLGLGQQVEVTIADEIRPAGDWKLPLEETIVLAYRNRAELEQQLVQREIDAQQREAALAAVRPQVSVFANYNVLGVFGDGTGLADGYQLGARVSWRFFDGGLARARGDQESIDIEIAEVSFEQQRNQIRFEVEEAYSTLQASEENIATATIAVQLAEESLRLARLRFQAGVGTQTDVIEAQTELTRARGNLLTAIVNYNTALAALQRAVSNVSEGPDGNQLFDLP